MPRPVRPKPVPDSVDRTDWLKTAAIFLVAVDHTGYFFVEDDSWWSVFGRLAAPSFFFLMGYARTPTVPLRWIWLGLILTALDSWNTDWAWVAPNILFSFVLIRMARPYVLALAERPGRVGFAILVCTLLAVLPVSGVIVDYGAEGWLWALAGLYQRLHVDRQSAVCARETARKPVASVHKSPANAGRMRILTCTVAAVAYIWLEQAEFSFTRVQLAAFIAGTGFLSLILCRFERGPSHIQPSGSVARILRFTGRHTLEIYAVQLAGSELIIRLLPDLAA